MEINKTFNYTKVESIPSGSVCQIPTLGLDTLYMSIAPSPQDNDDDPFTVIDIETGILYRESELPDGNLTNAILVYGCFEQYTTLSEKD